MKSTPNPVSTPALTAAPATTLWLLRHGEVEAKYQNVFGGRIDMNLSPRGQRQAAALADYLHGKKLDALYASPMKRVQQTLAPALLNGLPKPVVLPELREVDFGAWTGLAWDEIPTRFGVTAFEWLDQLDCDGIPQAESAAKLRLRLEPCLRQILTSHPGRQVALACHGGVIRMLLSILFELPLPRMSAFEIDYASVTQVVFARQKPYLHLLNFTPWRDLKPEFAASRTVKSN